MPDSEFNTSAHYSREFALDDTGYGLDEEESKFFRSQTGIQDEAQLKEHLLKVQAEALAIRQYRYVVYLFFHFIYCPSQQIHILAFETSDSRSKQPARLIPGTSSLLISVVTPQVEDLTSIRLRAITEART